MPLHRRLPKRGFKSLTREDIAEVRTSELQAMQVAEIDLAALKAAGIASRHALAAKVIVSGKLERKLVLKQIEVSKGARAMIEAAGGTIHLAEKPPAAPKKEKKAKPAKPAAEEAPKA
jgi:large subunit ribosomal protein L15